MTHPSTFWQAIRAVIVALGFAAVAWTIEAGFNKLERRAQWESEKQGEQVVQELKRIRTVVEGWGGKQ